MTDESPAETVAPARAAGSGSLQENAPAPETADQPPPAAAPSVEERREEPPALVADDTAPAEPVATEVPVVAPSATEDGTTETTPPKAPARSRRPRKPKVTPETTV